MLREFTEGMNRQLLPKITAFQAANKPRKNYCDKKQHPAKPVHEPGALSVILRESTEGISRQLLTRGIAFSSTDRPKKQP